VVAQALLVEMVDELFRVCQDLNTGEAKPAAAWPQMCVKSIPAKFPFYTEKGKAVPRWIPKEVVEPVAWPLSWTLHRGGALALARSRGLDAVVAFLLEQQMPDEADPEADLPVGDIFPGPLFVDKKHSRPAPLGSTPQRDDDPAWADLKEQCRAGPMSCGDYTLHPAVWPQPADGA
jgi:hypothetical protein